MLKSNQIKVFYHFEDIQQLQKNKILHNQGRPQGNTQKVEKHYFLFLGFRGDRIMEKLVKHGNGPLPLDPPPPPPGVTY